MRAFAWVWLGAAVVLGGPARAQQAVAVPAWSNLFNQTSGWTGADGIFSHLADGWDAPNDPHPNPTTLFIFNDTFIGTVNPAGQREGGWSLPHNTGATLPGVQPNPATIGFFWGNMTGTPQAVVSPATPQSLPGEWYWPVDGVVTGGTYYFFAQRMQQTSTGGAFDFAVAGIDLLSEPAAGYGDPDTAITQTDTPLVVPASGSVGLAQYGNGVMANTAEAGSPLADGYIYVYGVLNDSSTKWLLAARVLPADIANFAAYRFWNGSAWVADITQAAPIVSGVSEELSVTPLSNGQYALVYQLNDIGNYTAISYGKSPVGPFGKAKKIYTCPEPKEYKGEQVYCYNAKAHPALSAPGQLLISYNVNTFSSTANLNNASIYHPRFIQYTLPAGVTAGVSRR
jgi:hypothetical protein